MNETRQLIPANYLRELFDYDPETGFLTWKVRPRSHFSREWAYRDYVTKRQGRRAFTRIASTGYYTGDIIYRGKRYHLGVHRIAFVLMEGRYPAEIMDHVNGVRTDNRWINLREATRAQNVKNTPRPGLSGTKLNRNGRWVATIYHNKKSIHLGTYSTREEAHQAYVDGCNRICGEFSPFISRADGPAAVNRKGA